MDELTIAKMRVMRESGMSYRVIAKYFNTCHKTVMYHTNITYKEREKEASKERQRKIDRDIISKKNKEYHNANKERIKERKKEYYKTNKKFINKRKKKYCNNNTEHVRKLWKIQGRKRYKKIHPKTDLKMHIRI